MNEKEIAYRNGYAKGYQDAKKKERHGRWFEMVGSIEDGHTGEYYDEIYYNCINCDYAAGEKTPYCPNCGTIMDLPNITEQTENALRKLGEQTHGDN